jgi:nucleoside-diphosphate-sugar epimerase
MKALITGSNGFLGSALIERLLAHGVEDIRCFVRSGSDCSRLETLQSQFPEIHLEIFAGSLTSPEGILPALENVDIVYHLAAGMRGSAADLFLSSVVASKHLLEALVQRPAIKVVLVSSFGVYGVADLPRGHVVTEQTPLEQFPEKRDLYSYAKLRQERLFREYQEKHGFPLVILRPGVIYGPSGSALSSRIGLNLFGVFLHLGGRNVIPLSYVINCAEAIVVAGQSPEANGQVYNVHDDDLPTCHSYLRQYRREVRKLRILRLPYAATMFLSKQVERYNIRSKGQLPAIFTPYKTATTWKGNRFDNRKLKMLGWKQIVPTDEGLKRTFAYLRARPS